MDNVEVQLLQTTRPEVGDQVTVLWNGEEYKCTVTMVEDTRVKVHYKGYNARHDQWVPLSKPLGGEALAVRKDLFKEPSTEPEEEDLPLRGILKKPSAFFKYLESWTRKDLAEKCQNLGLSDEGTKKMLVERLMKRAKQKNA